MTTVPMSDISKYYKIGVELPFVWKNCLYLEWFRSHGGRVVLEADVFEISSSEPEREMSDEEERQA